MSLIIPSTTIKLFSFQRYYAKKKVYRKEKRTSVDKTIGQISSAASKNALDAIRSGITISQASKILVCYAQHQEIKSEVLRQKHQDM